MRLWNRSRTADAAFEDALQDCLANASSSEGIARCLRQYPQYAERLAPLLSTALSVRQGFTAPIREERRLAARRAFLQAAAQQSRTAPSYVAGRVSSPSRTPGVLLRPLWSAFAPAIVAAALFVVALVPILGLTSSSALPGDWNYGFKRSTERVRLALALDPADRFNLQVAFHQRRVREVEKLAATGRYDPSLLQALNRETQALLNTVSTSRVLGPSEAEKVVQVTDAEAQALQTQVEPNAPPAIKQDVAAVVAQSQQIQQQAAQVVQAKKEEAVAPPHAATASPSRQADALGSATVAPGLTATPLASGTPAPDSKASASATGTPAASTTPHATASAEPSGTPAITASAPAAPSATPVGTPIRPPVVAPILVPPAPPTLPVRTATAAIEASGTAAGEPAILVPSEPATIPAPSPASAPVSVATAEPAPSPAPTRTPTPPPPPTASPSPEPLVPPSQPPASSLQGRTALPAGGQQSFSYNGPTKPISEALASIQGLYTAAYITQPATAGGHVYSYYPGVTDPNTAIQPGSLVTIVTKPGVQPILIFPTGGG